MYKKQEYQSHLRKIFAVCLSLVLVLVISPAPQTAKAILVATQDITQDANGGVANYGYGFVPFAPTPIWQEFKPTFDNILAVGIHFYKLGSPGGTVTIEIKDDTGTTSLGSKTYNEADIPNDWKIIVFDSAIPVIPGTIYRIYFSIAGGTYDTDNRFSWWGNDSGTSTYSCSPVDCEHTFYGSNSDFDFRFRTYGNPAIFSDGFESGDMSAWSTTKGTSVSSAGFGVNTLCKLCVTTTGPLIESYSLKVRIPDKKPHYIQDNTPTWVKNYHTYFYIKPGKTLKMDKLNKFTVFQAKQGKKTPFFLQIRKKGTQFQLRGLVRTDAGTNLKTAWTLLPKASTKVDVKWEAASWPGADDGFLYISINDIPKVSKFSVDNDTLFIKFVRLGITAPINGAYNIFGSFKLDAFFSEAVSKYFS